MSDAHDFNNTETQAVIRISFLQVKAQREIHAVLTETLACFLPGRAKDLSASLYGKPCCTVNILTWIMDHIRLLYTVCVTKKFLHLCLRANPEDGLM